VLVNIYFKENWKKYISGGIVGGVVLVSLWAVSRGVRLHWLGDSGVENWYGSIGVSFGQPNFLAGYLLVTLPFWNLVNNRHKDRKIKILILSGVLVQIGAILLTDSIAGMVGVGVWLLWSWLSKYRRYGLILISLVLVIAGVFGLAWSTTANEIPEGRQRIMYRAFSAVLSRPVTGWGIANVDKAIDSVVWPMKFKNDVYVDKAHSHLLEMLVTTGFVGLGLYILMVSVWLKRLMVSLKNKPEDHAWRETLLLVVCLYIFHTQTNVISIAEEVVFWVMMGLI
jgi:O-antigen ligase